MNRLKVLVVDDQATMIRVMERMLASDYEVLTASSGSDGLAIAREILPDIILLDMVMPEMTGIEVCLQLKADTVTRHIPVIFVTSMDDRHNEEAGLKAGAVDYISKPPSPAIVKSRLVVHLQNSRQTRFIEAVASGYLSDLDEIRAEARLLI